MHTSSPETCFFINPTFVLLNNGRFFFGIFLFSEGIQVKLLVNRKFVIFKKNKQKNASTNPSGFPYRPFSKNVREMLNYLVICDQAPSSPIVAYSENPHFCRNNFLR